MKATIGRIVIYKLSDSDIPENSNYADELPAIIVRVHSDDCVNLKVINDGENNFWKPTVYEGDNPGQYHWPVINKE